MYDKDHDEFVASETELLLNDPELLTEAEVNEILALLNEE